MRIIELYILKRVFILFCAVMLAATGISWTIKVLARINFLTTSGQTLSTIFCFSLLLIPSVIFLVIPFALVIAIIATLSTMNRDSELTIISASGFPRHTVLKPVLFLAIIASCASFYVANFVTPKTHLNMRHMLENSNSHLVNFFVHEGKFQKLTDNLYIEIGKWNLDGTIDHLFIADQRDPKIDLFYYAKKASIISNKNGNLLILNNGEIERIEHKNNSVSIIQFSSYNFNLSEFIPNNNVLTVYPKDRTLFDLINPDQNDPYYRLKPLQYRAVLHRRLTEWLYPIVFSLIATAIVGNSSSYRQTRIFTNFSAIVLPFLIYWIGYFVAEKANSNLAYVPLLYIMPVGISLIIPFILFTNRKIIIPTKFNDIIQMLFQKMIVKFGYPKPKNPTDNVS
ncbi:LPS export ABC transporter permease LptF [Bartonella sp. B41]